MTKLASRLATSDVSHRPRPGDDASRGELLAMLTDRRAAFLAFAKRRVGSEADAEDLLQQALLRASEEVGTLRTDDRLEAWFYRILRNTISDHRANVARRESRLEVFARDASEAPPEEAAVCACSLGVLETLHPAYAEIIRHVDIEEESLDQASRALGITPNNAKVRLHRARGAVRDALIALCGTDSSRACMDCSCDE